jgi:hypothetical protein
VQLATRKIERRAHAAAEPTKIEQERSIKQRWGFARGGVMKYGGGGFWDPRVLELPEQERIWSACQVNGKLVQNFAKVDTHREPFSVFVCLMRES